jgi:hypothetical protein
MGNKSSRRWGEADIDPPLNEDPQHSTAGTQPEREATEDQGKHTNLGAGGRRDNRIFPFVPQSEENAILAFSQLSGGTPAPMLVRLLAFLRSNFQGFRLASVQAAEGTPFPLQGPSDVHVLRDGRTIVVDDSAGSLYLFSAGGIHLRTLCSGRGKELGQFDSCGGICELNDGTLIASDRLNSRLQLFSINEKGDANFYREISTGDFRPTYIAANSGDLVVFGDPRGRIGSLSVRKHDEDGKPDTPQPVLDDCRDITPSGIVYLRDRDQFLISDFTNHRLLLLSGDGKKFVKKDIKFSKPVYPTGLAATRGQEIVLVNSASTELWSLRFKEGGDDLVPSKVFHCAEDGVVKSMKGIAIVPSTGGVVVTDRIGRQLHYYV